MAVDSIAQASADLPADAKAEAKSDVVERGDADGLVIDTFEEDGEGYK